MAVFFRLHRRIVVVLGMSEEHGARRVPVVLIAAEGDLAHLALEVRVFFGSVVAEADAHLVSGFLITIDNQQGDLSVGTLEGVGSDQSVAGAVVNIGLGWKDLVRRASG